MVPLAVDPEALFAAGSAVVAAGGGVAADLTILAAGMSAHTGLDVAGMVFGLAYQDAGESLVKAAAAAINACRRVGAAIQQGAANYSRAEVASTLGGGGAALQPPPEPEKAAAPGPPGTWGPGRPPPPLWALVQSFLDDVWPDGDVPGLRASAGRWRTFGAAVGALSGALNASKSLFDSQHLPEGGLIDNALSQIGTLMSRLGDASEKLAAGLDGIATEVEHAQNAIRDLLSRLQSLTNLVHDVVLVLEGDAIDEIKKIARDIAAIQHNLGREARAFEQGINLVMQLGDGLVVDFEKHIRRELTNFLGEEVGNPVATVFDAWVNANEGMLKGAFGTLRGLADLDPRRFLIDPEGATDTWKGMFSGTLLDIALHPKEGMEANLQNWKSLLHLDDWSTARPGLGFGENVFDVASLFIPGGGEAGVVTDGAGAAARGAEAAADAAGTAERAGGLSGLARIRGMLANIAKSGSSLTDDFTGLGGNLPKIEPPGGRPVGLPPGKPPETPVGPTPRSPESTPAHAAPNPGRPATPGVPHDSRPLAPNGPGDASPGPVSGPHEPAPTPAGTAPDGLPASAAHPHDPMSVPMDRVNEPAHPAAASPLVERPPDLAAPGSGVHAPGEGGVSAEGSHGSAPQEGGPHEPGDGGPPGSHPHEFPPHDGSPDESGDDHGPTADLTSDDLSALADYTGTGYEDLNDALRSNALDASQHARAEALNHALGKLPPYEGPVVRGTNLPPEILSLYRPGEYFIEKGFMSTTTDPVVAQSPAFAGNVEFRIFSSTGREISAFSILPEEQEVLFQAHTRFFVLSKTVDSVSGRTIIELIED